MKINGIIKEKRLEKGFTQEQLAEYLGVTAPAVNKWEKDVSYPEITLLPVLARVLGTDLNTLLSFQEDLTKAEITNIVNHITEVFNTKGFREAYREGMERIKEYPNCHLLILNIGLILQGTLMVKVDSNSEYEEEKAEIERLFERVADSSDKDVSYQAKSILISNHRNRKEYDKAQALIDTLPDESLIDKKLVQANNWIAQEKYEDAGKLMEQKLIAGIGDIYGTLLTLMELAIYEKRFEDAKGIADIYQKTAKSFDMWEYGWYVAHFQLYCALEEWDKFLECLELMLRALKKEWSPHGAVLFHYTDFAKYQKQSGEKNASAMMREMILNGIYQDEKTAFLKDDPRLKELLESVK